MVLKRYGFKNFKIDYTCVLIHIHLFDNEPITIELEMNILNEGYNVTISST